MLRIAITGASGLIGTALRRALEERGDQAVPLVRSRHRQPDELADIDAVVNLAGAGLGDRRWNAAYKQEIRESRVIGTQALAQAILDTGRDIRLISASAVGFYGDRGTEILTEESKPGTGFLAELCQDWEKAASSAPNTALIRTGIVLSADGGALARMLPLARLGVNGPLAGGRQFWSWITLADHVRAILWLIDNVQVTGPVNLTAPQPVPQRSFAKALGEALHRPASVPTPKVALRTTLGEFSGVLTASQRVIPEVLLSSGFVFEHAELQDAMAWLIS